MLFLYYILLIQFMQTASAQSGRSSSRERRRRSAGFRDTVIGIDLWETWHLAESQQYERAENQMHWFLTALKGL